MTSSSSLTIHPVPAFQDNYLWVIHNGRHAAAIDPGDAAPVLEYVAANRFQLVAIICTHHHGDHVGGVEGLLDALHLRGRIPVFRPACEQIPARTRCGKATASRFLTSNLRSTFSTCRATRQATSLISATASCFAATPYLPADAGDCSRVQPNK